MNAKVSEMILEQAQKVGALKHELSKTEKSLKEKADLLADDLDNETLRGEVDTLVDAVEAQRGELAKEETRQKTLLEIERINGTNAAKTEPVKKGEGPAYIRKSKAAEKPSSLIFKAAAADFISFVQRRSPFDVMNDVFKGDDALQAFYGYAQKTAVGPANTYTDGWAKELAGEATIALLEDLTDVSIVSGLTQYAQTLNFNGAAVIKVPSVQPRVPANLTEPSWVGEGGQIPVTRFQINSQSLYNYKVAAIATTTEELIRSSVTDIVSLFQRLMTNDYAVKMDGNLLNNSSAVLGTRPAGLLNGLTPLTPSAASTAVDKVIEDVNKLAAALITTNAGVNPVLIMNRLDHNAVMAMRNDLGQFQFADELRRGYLMGYPVLVSNTVPQHMLVMLDPGSLALAFDGPEFATSRETVIVEANADDTAPTHATDDGTAGVIGTEGEVPRNMGLHPTDNVTGISGVGGAGEGGYRTRSMFQSWCVAVRAIFPSSFGMMRAGGIAYMGATTWTS